MQQNPSAYGPLSTLFYNAIKPCPTEREVQFYSKFIEQNTNGRVLEAMSGSGRLQISLLQRGYIVDGVDNSSAMLQSCRERCTALGLTPDLHEQSLLELSLPHQYKTIIIAVASFQLINDKTEALAALKRLRAHLAPDGVVLIDMFTPDQSETEATERSVRLDKHRTIRVRSRKIFEPEAQQAYGYCNYELLENGIPMHHEHELIQVTWYSDDELQKLFADAGLAIVTIHETTLRASGPSRIVQACHA